MRKHRLSGFKRRWSALLLGGSLLVTLEGGCLPEDYFALVARSTAVLVADSLIGTALAPLLGSLNVTPDDGEE